MEKIETHEDLIDLGAATVKTMGGGDSNIPDGVQLQFKEKTGMSAD